MKPAVKRGRTVIKPAVLSRPGFSCRRYWSPVPGRPAVVVSYDEYIGADFLTRVAYALLAVGGREYIANHAEEILAALDELRSANHRDPEAAEVLSATGQEENRKSDFTIRRLVREATMLGRYGRYLQDQGYEIEFKKEQLISGVCHEGLLVRVPAAGGA